MSPSRDPSDARHFTSYEFLSDVPFSAQARARVYALGDRSEHDVRWKLSRWLELRSKAVKPDIAVKRVYGDVPATSDGCRILAERLWPRGLKKEALKLDFWLRDVAPSTPLRRWFSHDPKKWETFKRRYFKELDANPNATAEIRQHARKGKVTLLFSSKDEEHNNVIALREYLLAR